MLLTAGALGLDPKRVNGGGGAIALGCPRGVGSAVMAVRLLSELERAGGGTGLLLAPAAGGQTVALVLG